MSVNVKVSSVSIPNETIHQIKVTRKIYLPCQDGLLFPIQTLKRENFENSLQHQTPSNFESII